ncbi:DUF2975 domain-containing protein [Flavobacterium sp.]|uniref:DUF2975 domain-containing protein n=1 Tax=Flavobacterium sp. TaxID=239 RepID=UPI002B4B7096|nr:DUF2975 domain-containing protein [Flavobacterium sp.]HLF52351.1 DUF2975 domain-containing protein [Flavobacterium sp.]
MRKLYLLKAIVDFVWIISLITIPFLLFFIGFLLISDESFDFPIKMNGIEITVLDLNAKVVLFFGALSYLALIYSLYFMKKLLSLFQSRIIFDEKVIKYFNKIGNLFIISAFLAGVPTFIYKIITREIGLEIGYNPFLYLVSLGLFFMVLSEVFKMAKTMKDENELTV